MRPSSWSTEPPPAERNRTPLWVKAAACILALPFLLGFLLWTRVRTTQAKAWPVILQLSRRLQTDEEARRLFQANPALARMYSSEEVFLDRVRAHRASFATLPDRAPSTDRYEVVPGPFGFMASVRGAEAAWVIVEVRSSLLFRQIPGEGLTRLEFSPAREPSGQERRALRRARAASDWARHQEVCARLATDEGVRVLWRQEPALHHGFKDEAALLRFAAEVRPDLRPLPVNPVESRVRLRRQLRLDPSGESVRLSHPFSRGDFTTVWTQGALSGLEYTPRN